MIDFRIRAGCPEYIKKTDEEAETLSDAVEAIFPMWTESAIVMWKDIPIPLGYKYDISIMLDDILDLLGNIRSNHFGEMEIHWASNTFANKWKIRWDKDNIELESEWGCVVGGTEQLLTSRGNIIIPKQVFTREWKQLLGNVIVGLLETGYTEDNLQEMRRLITEYNAIDGKGVFYP